MKVAVIIRMNKVKKRRSNIEKVIIRMNKVKKRTKLKKFYFLISLRKKPIYIKIFKNNS